MADAGYQHRHIKKVPRYGGASAWKYYYRQTGPDGVRRLKAQTFSSLEYPTEASVWKAAEGQLASLNENTLAGKFAYTFGQLIDKYLKEEHPALAWSTQGTKVKARAANKSDQARVQAQNGLTLTDPRSHIVGNPAHNLLWHLTIRIDARY